MSDLNRVLNQLSRNFSDWVREGSGNASEWWDHKAAIQKKLRGLKDDADGSPAIAEVYDTAEIYSGPYVREAPDLFVGFHVGWRASWDCATGVINDVVFEDNTKSWSGDHCINPPDVPGIFLANRKIDTERINIMDIGPTVLDLFGVRVPAYCDGRTVMAVGGEKR